MTIKLYEKDAYQIEFDANVLCQTKKEEVYDIILDQTAFFPEEGGQTCDRGTLNEIEVIDVQIIDGIIHHYTKEKIQPCVHGIINWTHRYSNMQHHTAEHILSGLMHSQYHLNNIGFHLGINEITTDYNGILDEEQIQNIEQKVNEVIQENHRVKAYYLEDYTNVEYRAKLEIDKPRLVEIEGIDLCACCAPHVQSTSEVGILKITKSMKIKHGTRLYFLCGNKAYQDYVLKHNEVKTISYLLSASPYETSEHVQKLIEDNYKLKMNIKALHKQRIDDKIIPYQENHIVFEEGLDRETQLYYFNRLLEKARNNVLLISGNRFMTNNLETLQSYSYRGGGKNGFYQGTIEFEK